MKKLALLALLGTLAWSVDFSQLSTDELMKLRGTVAPSERPAFRAEMQKRMQSMSPEQRQQMMNSRGKGMGMGQGRGMGQGMQNRPTFTSYDFNNDGKITPKEFEDARNARRVAKANQGKMLRNAGTAPTFENIDSNGNGAISQEEFSAHQAQRRNQRSR